MRHLRAVEVAGLRPSEWATAVLEHDEASGQTSLRIRNGKRGNGRAHGPDRTLLYDDPSRGVHRRIGAFKACLDAALVKRNRNPQDGASDRYFDDLRAFMRSVWRESFLTRRGIALYTARPRFAAWIKAVLEPPEVAALMGHAIDDTAYRNYARRWRTGGRRQLPIPRALQRKWNVCAVAKGASPGRGRGRFREGRGGRWALVGVQQGESRAAAADRP